MTTTAGRATVPLSEWGGLRGVEPRPPVETGCYAAEIVWPEDEAAQFRELMIAAVGRDCFCEPGGHCWLLESAMRLTESLALEDGLVAAFAAIQRDAETMDDGPCVGTIIVEAEALGLDGARVCQRVVDMAGATR